LEGVRDPVLAPLTNPYYRAFDLDYSDIERAKVFIKELGQFETANQMPQLLLVRMGNDHTYGAAAGKVAPQSLVADNDAGIGMLVEAVSRSKFWKETAIFIIEDDAQNGPDHVDSHRTAGLVISPFVKRRSVDSTMYSTMSMLRTVELLLGLPPMTQHDAAAPPMVNTFTVKADLSGFTAVTAKIDLLTKNPPQGYGATISAAMDFSDYDRVDEDALNRILWHSIKGGDVPYPAPVRRALPTPLGLLRFPTEER